MITKEDKLLIKNSWASKDNGARQLTREFSDKNWKWKGIKNCWEFCKKWFAWSSYRKEVADHAHCAAVTTFLQWKNGFKVRKVNRTHICLPSGHFEHTLWLPICFLCTFINFVFHTMLDAAGELVEEFFPTPSSVFLPGARAYMRRAFLL